MMLLQAGSNACTQDKRREYADNPSSRASRAADFSILRRSKPMRTFLASSTVLLTILFSFAFGIAFGYVVIQAILRAFARKPQPAKATSGSTAVVASAPGQ